MNIQHHLPEDTLLAYAAGDLDQGTSYLVAAHLALCPKCREAAELAEDIGGGLIEDVDPVGMSDFALGNVLEKLDIEIPEVSKPRAPVGSSTPVLPEPLRSLVGGDIDAIKWQTIGPGVKQMRLDNGESTSSIRLLKIAAGASVLEHGHNGEELTMVLSGGFDDGDQSFTRGDVEYADQGTVHQPVAMKGEDCICLAVTSGPLKFFDIFGRVAQPFFRI